MASGGDILEVTVNHPTLGSKTFFPKAGEDSEFDPGGFRSADEGQGVTAAGSMIDQMNNTRWMFGVAIEWDDQVQKELAFLKSLQASPTLGDWTVRRVNQSVWRGNGKPVGDLKAAGNQSTIPLKVSGGGEMEQIA